jgi:hypothetical protein
MQGTLNERQTLSVAMSLATAAGALTTETIELTFDSLYDQPSSLAELGGSFAPGNAFPYVVGSDGAIFLSELICEGNGQFSIIDPAHDLYRVQMTIKCDNRGAVTWNGLATLDTSVGPQQLRVGWSGSGSGSGDGEDWIRQD